MKQYKGIFLDVDGTLVESWTTNWLPDVLDSLLPLVGKVHLALLTNQGGANLRYWMEKSAKEGETWGRPESLPTEEQIKQRIYTIESELQGCKAYIAFAFRSQGGQWAPIPDRKLLLPSWRRDWRKPSTGMIEQAAMEIEAKPEEILYIGDTHFPDRKMTLDFGADFLWAKDITKLKELH